MMKTETIEIEYLIRKIEEMKCFDYECYTMNEGLDDPAVLAQATNRLLGFQSAYDNIIHWLRKQQGRDDE